MKHFSTNNLLVAGIAVVLVAVALILMLSMRQSRRVKTTVALLDHTEEVLNQIQHVITISLDNETGARGYVITGSESFLAPLQRSEKDFRTAIAALQQLVSDNPHQLQWLDSLKTAINSRIIFSDSLVQSRKKSGLPATVTMVESGVGKRATENIRRIGNEIEKIEKNLLAQRKKTNDISIKTLNQLLYIVLAAAILLGAFVVRRIRNDWNRQKASEQQFVELLDAAPDATVMVNDQGLIKRVNKQMKNLFGYSKDEISGQPVELLIPDEVRAKHIEHRHHFIKAPKIRTMGAGIELKAVKKDGTLFPVEISLSPIQTTDGLWVAASIRDITQRKQNEALIKKQKEEIQDFIDSMSTLCAKVSTSGHLLMVNKIAVQATGLSLEELLGTSFINGHWWTYKTEVHARVAASFQTACSGVPVNYDECIFVFNQVLPINFSLIPIFTTTGEVDYIVAEGRDISSLKSTEAALQKQTEGLEKANKELEAFTYSVSHDLRAPLRIIDGYADILAEDYKDKLDEEATRVMGIIQSNAQRMGQLIDDLLNLSHTGRKELLHHPTDMNMLVKSVVDEHLSTATRPSVFHLEDLEPATCDSSLIRQVWINLVSNALKYSAKANHPEITIQSTREKGQIVYAIKDNGVGFDMKYAEKLFGVFQRLHKQAEFEGTGIGLALVNRIITKHNGKVWAVSEPGKGASFFFSLPV